MTMAPAQFQQLLQTALAHHQKGRLADAEKLYRQARAAQPNHFDVLHLSGALAYQQGRYADSLDLLTKALRVNSRSAPCMMRAGLANVALGNFSAGETQLRQALKLDPQNIDAWSGLATALRHLGKVEEAIAAHEQVSQLNPKSAAPHAMIGGLINEIKGPAAALPHFQRAVELDAHYAVAWCNLGISQLALQNFEAARASLDRALQEDPKLLQAMVARGLVDQQTYRLEEAIPFLDRALSLEPAHHEARSGKLLTLNYLDRLSTAELYAEHAAFTKVLESAAITASVPLPSNRDPERRLRIGFVSPDLRAHSIAYFLEPLLKHLDPAQFEIFLYHNHSKVDAVSDRLRAHATSWKNLAGLPDAMAEKVLRADNLDIAIDLAGHTGFNRLAVFARRIAPVQITYLGYPNTTAVRAIDYRFVDEITDPLGTNGVSEEDAYYTEKRVRFSPCAWSFSPPPNAPEPGRIENAPLTFGSFNNPAKFSPRTFSLWARLLTAVPAARLLLKGTGLTAAVTRSLFEAKLASVGIDLTRVELLDRTPNLTSHLEIYHRIDVALDPFPYHGTTTTCEALWMGVPVVTLAGDRHAARVGASLLTAVGHPEWIASSEDDYIAIAAALAAEPTKRAALRQSLRSEMSHAILLNHAEQAQHFGNALRACWRERVA